MAPKRCFGFTVARMARHWLEPRGWFVQTARMRRRLAGIVCALLVSCLPLMAAPNFIVFIADDLGDGDLGCYGNRAIKTPNVDALAGDGIRFTRAYLTISSCSPSRCSILTGRYPHNTSAEDLHQPLPADQMTLAQYLKGSGYASVCVGKWHLGEAEKAHWDKVVTCLGRDTESNAINELRALPVEKPFFLWVASTDPHRPYQLDTISKPHDPADVIVPPYLPDHPKIRKELALYYDEVARFDQCVGGVLKALEKTGRDKDTVVVFLSDNGMPFPRAKTTLYDSGIRTPLIVRWPGKTPAGSINSQLFSVVDLAPTLLSIAGVSQKSMQGIDASAMFADPAVSLRKQAFAEANWHDFEKFTRATTDGRFKLIRNYYWDRPLWNSVDSINSITWQGMIESKKSGSLSPAQAFLFHPTRPFEEFYSLADDPFETKNLITNPSYHDQIARLRAVLDNWRVDTADAMPEQREKDGWTMDGNPLPHNQPWYDRWLKQGKKNQFETY
jgi:N-sulfoglucosamine sulfohydrolase